MQTPARPSFGSRQGTEQVSSPGSASFARTVAFRTPGPSSTSTSGSPGLFQQSLLQQQQQQSTGGFNALSSNAAGAFPRSTSAPSFRPLIGQSSSNQQGYDSAQPSANSMASYGSATPNTASSYASPSQYTLKAPESASKSGRPARQTASTASVPLNPELVMKARRTAASKKLRVHLVLLLAWYLITASRLYGLMVQQALQTFPKAEGLFVWLVDRLFPLLCIYNASQGFLTIKWAPQSPAGSAVSTGSASSSLGTTTRSLPALATVHRSSPATRPTSSPSQSPALSYRSRPAHQQGQQGSAPKPPQSQHHHSSSTPSRAFKPQFGNIESPTAALHRALLASAGTPPRSSPPGKAGYDTLGAGTPASNATPVRDTASPRVQAYWARHEPMASSLHRSVSGREDLDRLLAGEA